MKPLPQVDLAQIVDRSEDDLRIHDGSHLLVTGGTGFVGSWLVESMMAACQLLGVRVHMTIPSRAPEAHLVSRPHLRNRPDIDFITADVSRPLPSIGHVDAIVHAATDASASLNNENPDEMLNVITAGMSHVLELATSCGAIPMLFTSSGAVYGTQPPTVDRLPETHEPAEPTNTTSAYEIGKRRAEALGVTASATSPMRFVIARLFAFLGPLLPIDRHFAAGNFIGDALAGRSIRVAGDGTAIRSYMHPVDLSVWMWALLARGVDQRAYNVGSESAVTIAELAGLVGGHAGVPAEIAGTAVPDAPPHRYVPSTDRARRELSLDQRIDLDAAIERTIRWHHEP